MRAAPKIGIALGAGAARGWAHIGVLLELAEHGIFPDVIAGTSVGAVVGGCYAAGKLENVELFARSLTKKSVFGMMDVSFSGVGLLTGARLRRRLHQALEGQRLEELPKSFAAVATEVGTGHEIWLTKGDAVEAICASYALPGIFEPVRINGRWLFDGALVNPVPVTVCRALGAEIVLAVNLVGDNGYRGSVVSDRLSIEPSLEKLAVAIESEPRRNGLFGALRGTHRRHFGKREDGAPGMGSAMMDAFNIAQGRISRSRLAGDPPDVIINARVSKIGLFDFHRAGELIEIGREAARRAITEIAEHIALTPRSDDAPPLKDD
ncbi:Patatin [Methylocella silvestris BL2]|uniref:Patatin n=1 Tax=Methylocella silvestris (strain DSM 15510 / CIP 108128 / LMG 27833 / NCIMB 13906 / BL2) TaxID=395965 RepID=B8EQR1_METSB|nr:patatin-like phospholipase family protein [Methylocella silvestris]ACK49332.1 Patatin [Methylocella silvestris BL2]